MIIDDETSAYERAVNELKRIDHLIYVSLKYTRTVDVIRNIIDRMLNAFDIVFNEILERAKNNEEIFEIPAAPRLRCDLVRKMYKGDKEFAQYLDFYLLLRQFKNAEYTAQQEFRRYVTMTATFPNGEQQTLDIDKITEYYQIMKDFVVYIEAILEPKA
jgi:hypothetical protein